MSLDDSHCYQALRARDPRFDGAFFVGVTTTGIYCRPVCPARTPREERCRFFSSAAAAERRGFRPCLRCRPELAPHGALHAEQVAITAPVDAMQNHARRAGERIASGALNAHSLDDLAESLGISTRHLRRAVEREFGASPVALAQTRRLLTAKQLLTDTTLTMSAVAMASGFGSVRRFNALFQERYRLSPADLRARARKPPSEASMSDDQRDGVTLTLALRAPYDFEGICRFLAARAIPGVEQVHTVPQLRYTRVVRLGDACGVVSVESSISAQKQSVLEVALPSTLLPALVPLLARLRHLFDLDAHPHIISEHLRSDPLLAPAIAASPGRRVAGALLPFELAVRAVLGQQVSVRGATTLSGRLIAAISVPLAVQVHTGLTHEPITAERLADASLPQVRSIGLPEARAATLRTLARAVADGLLPLLEDGVSRRHIASPSDARTLVDSLMQLRGIGPWTANYIAMRVLHEPDAFPDGDLALQKAAGGLTAAQLRQRAEGWRPWRAYAAMHLWSLS